MGVIPRELEPGLWRWQSTTPGWDDRDPRSTSFHHAFESPGALVVVDPAQFSASTPELDELYAQAGSGRALHVVMADPTNKWHTGERICRKHGGTIWGAPATAKLLDDPSLLRILEAGEPGPGEVVAVDVGGEMWSERAIWVPDHRTLVFDTIFMRSPADGPLRLSGPRTSDERVRRWFQTEIAPTFEPLLELPVERIALSHGDGVTDEPLEAMLDALARGI